MNDLFTHISSADKSKILEDAGLDENSFATYVEEFKDIGGAGSIADNDGVRTIAEENKLLSNNVKELKDKQKALKDTSSETYKAAKANGTLDSQLKEVEDSLESSEKALENSNGEIEDMALRCLQTNTGLQELADN